MEGFASIYVRVGALNSSIVVLLFTDIGGISAFNVVQRGNKYTVKSLL